LDVALKLKKLGFFPVVLNMASYKSPGGGYKYGAGAQEENLFRRSNYYLSLGDNNQKDLKRSQKYPIDPFNAIYSPSVTVFRDTEKNGYAFLPNPMDMSFIAMPAYNKPPLQNNNSMTEEYAKNTKQKMRIIFHVALENKHDVVVLSAMGCGAYKNPPRQIANLFREVLSEPAFRGRFRAVIFAIFDDGNTGLAHNPEGNFEPFDQTFETFGAHFIKMDWKVFELKYSHKLDFPLSRENTSNNLVHETVLRGEEHLILFSPENFHPPVPEKILRGEEDLQKIMMISSMENSLKLDYCQHRSSKPCSVISTVFSKILSLSQKISKKTLWAKNSLNNVNNG
jgi:uncharacterized protein (TIGR02452 family)